MGTDAMKMCRVQRQCKDLKAKGEAIPDELAVETDLLWSRVIKYCERQANSLLRLDIQPHFVFEGDVLPAKMVEREKRAR